MGGFVLGVSLVALRSSKAPTPSRLCWKVEVGWAMAACFGQTLWSAFAVGSWVAPLEGQVMGQAEVGGENNLVSH